jgi:hypothetical protein
MAVKVSGTTVIDDSRGLTNIVNVAANGTISFNNIAYPTTDGSDGEALVTDGLGNLSFASAGVTTGKAIAMAIVFG